MRRRRLRADAERHQPVFHQHGHSHDRRRSFLTINGGREPERREHWRGGHAVAEQHDGELRDELQQRDDALVANGVTFNGPGTLTNAAGHTMTLKNVTINANSALDNQGTLITNATVTVNGPFTTAAASLLDCCRTTPGVQHVHVGGELHEQRHDRADERQRRYGSILAVSGSNTLTNAAGGTIHVARGSRRPTDDRCTAEQPGHGDPQSAADVEPRQCGAHEQRDDRCVGADFALTQSGTNPSFTNTGTVTIGAGHFWTINGGTLNQNAGSMAGGHAVTEQHDGELRHELQQRDDSAGGERRDVQRPGHVDERRRPHDDAEERDDQCEQCAGQPGDADHECDGDGERAFTTTAASILRLLPDNTTGFSTFTSAGSFTNNGTIELTSVNAGYGSILAVSGSNTLTNAAGGTITTLVGAGGPRTIDAQLNNLGTVTSVRPLTLSHASAAHTNSGRSMRRRRLRADAERHQPVFHQHGYSHDRRRSFLDDQRRDAEPERREHWRGGHAVTEQHDGELRHELQQRDDSAGGERRDVQTARAR